MSQRGIGDLKRPPLKARMDLGNNAKRSQFESLGMARGEDAKRAKLLKRAAVKHPDVIGAHAAIPLSRRLAASGEGEEVPDSLASSVHMRSLRVNVAGALWKLMRAAKPVKPHGFTIIPRNWQFTSAELDAVDPVKLLNTLRAALYKKGAAKATGWLICFIHGEYDPVWNVYRVHVHGFAHGSMVEVIDRLRQLPNYRTQRYQQDGRLNPIYRPVQVTRQPPDNRRRQLTYRLQSYWPSRAIMVSADGKSIRTRRRGRMVEPYHSQVLLWLDRWKLADLTLMIGLRVTQAGLIQTKPVELNELWVK